MPNRALDKFFRDLARTRSPTERVLRIGRYLQPHSPRVVRAFVGSFREVVVRGGAESAAALLEALRAGGAPGWLEPSCRARFVLGRPRTSVHASFAVHVRSPVERIVPLGDGSFLVLHQHGRGAWLRRQRAWIAQPVTFANMRRDRTDAVGVGRRCIAGITDADRVAVWRVADGAIVAETPISVEPHSRVRWACSGPWLVVSTSGRLSVLRAPYDLLVESRQFEQAPDELEFRGSPFRVTVAAGGLATGYLLPGLEPYSVSEPPPRGRTESLSPLAAAERECVSGGALVATRPPHGGHWHASLAPASRSRNRAHEVDAFDGPQSLTVAADGRHALLSNFAGAVRIFSFDKGVVPSSRACAHKVWQLHVDDHRENVVVESTSDVGCYRISDGARRWQASPRGLRAVGLVIAGNRVVCPLRTGWVTLSAESGVRLVSHDARGGTSAVAANGAMFACGDECGSVSLHDGDDRQVWTTQIAATRVMNLQFAGNELLAGLADKTLVLDSKTGSVVQEISSASVFGVDSVAPSRALVWVEPKSAVVWRDGRAWQRDALKVVAGVAATADLSFVMHTDGHLHRFSDGGCSVATRCLPLAPRRGYPCLLLNRDATAVAVWDGSRVCVLSIALTTLAEWVGPNGVRAVTWRDSAHVLVGDSLGHVVEVSARAPETRATSSRSREPGNAEPRQPQRS